MNLIFFNLFFLDEKNKKILFKVIYVFLASGCRVVNVLLRLTFPHIGPFRALVDMINLKANIERKKR